MTNEEKTERLEEIADNCEGYGSYEQRQSDPALLLECAAMMRERGTVEWNTGGGATKNGLYLWAGPVCNGFASMVTKGKRPLYLDWHPTLQAAQAAAVAWVDEQEGRNV